MATTIKLEAETTEPITPEHLELEGAQPLPLPEIPVDLPEELAPEFVAVEEVISETRASIL